MANFTFFSWFLEDENTRQRALTICTEISVKNFRQMVLVFFLATVQPLLRQTEKFITYITGSPGTLTLKHIVRTSFSDNRNHLSNRICNYLLNITRYTIWTVRNIQRHEHRSVNLYNFARLLIKERLNIEHFLYLYKYNDLDLFSPL